MSNKYGGIFVRLTRMNGTNASVPEQGFTFQCPPSEDFTIGHSYNHTEYDTVSLGQFSRPFGRNLRSVSFNTLFYSIDTAGDLPAWTFNVKEDVDAMSRRLVDICESGTNFMLTVAAQGQSVNNTVESGSGVLLQMPATLRSVSLSDKAGENDTRYVAVEFREYRDPDRPNLIDKIEDPVPPKGSGPSFIPGKVTLKLSRDKKRWTIRTYGSTGKPIRVHITQPITLLTLAKDYYGSGRRASTGAKHILAANKTTLSSGWRVGTRLSQHSKAKRGLTIQIPKWPT